MQVARVYKRRLFGWKLVGWIDDDARIHEMGLLRTRRMVKWSADKHGRIYIELFGLRGLVGSVDSDGLVRAEYGMRYGRVLPTNDYVTMPGVFAGATVFQLSPDGTIYRLGLFRSSKAGKAEGTDNPITMAALALFLLL
jgi:hypothetical protein